MCKNARWARGGSYVYKNKKKFLAKKNSMTILVEFRLEKENKDK
jgi:hypothetical protein